jgi:hypothetical protein
MRPKYRHADLLQNAFPHSQFGALRQSNKNLKASFDDLSCELYLLWTVPLCSSIRCDRLLDIPDTQSINFILVSMKLMV